MERAFPGNILLIHLLNGLAAFAPVQALAAFVARDLLYLLVLGLLAVWARGGAEARRWILLAALSAGLGLMANQLLGALLQTPRPFVAGDAVLRIAHPANPSFPSDHGVIFWSIGFCLGLRGPLRRVGVAVRWAGLAVAWARVSLGVHYPLDFLGAAAVALAAVVLVLRQEARLMPVVARLEALHAGLAGRLAG